MPTLLLLRHGQSAWNAARRFAGRVDVDLTSDGEGRTRRAGRLLVEADLLPTVLHTCLLSRSAWTGAITLTAAGRAWLPVHRSWRLDESCFGALAGRERSEAAHAVVLCDPRWCRPSTHRRKPASSAITSPRCRPPVRSASMTAGGTCDLPSDVYRDA